MATSRTDPRTKVAARCGYCLRIWLLPVPARSGNVLTFWSAIFIGNQLSTENFDDMGGSSYINKWFCRCFNYSSVPKGWYVYNFCLERKESEEKQGTCSPLQPYPPGKGPAVSGPADPESDQPLRLQPADLCLHWQSLLDLCLALAPQDTWILPLVVLVFPHKLHRLCCLRVLRGSRQGGRAPMDIFPHSLKGWRDTIPCLVRSLAACFRSLTVACFLGRIRRPFLSCHLRPNLLANQTPALGQGVLIQLALFWGGWLGRSSTRGHRLNSAPLCSTDFRSDGSSNLPPGSFWTPTCFPSGEAGATAQFPFGETGLAQYPSGATGHF